MFLRFFLLFVYFLVMLLQLQEIIQEKVLLHTLMEISTTVTLSLDAEKVHRELTPTTQKFMLMVKQKILTKEPGKTMRNTELVDRLTLE